MLSSKNDVIKELRRKLNQYEPNADDLKEEDWGWMIGELKQEDVTSWNKIKLNCPKCIV